MQTDAQRARVFLLSIGALAALIGVNYWCFRRFGGLNYFEWFMEDGPMIGMGVALVAVIFEDLEFERDLVSAHPARYLAACFGAAGIFFFALGTHFRTRARDRSADSWFEQMAQLWDVGITFLLIFPILGLVIAWVLVVAPLNYIVTLFSGALARQAMRGLQTRCVVREEGNLVTAEEMSADLPLPAGAKEVSLARKAVALTSAISSMVLWLAGFGWQALH